jgi:hypothetical protein
VPGPQFLADIRIAIAGYLGSGDAADVALTRFAEMRE